MSLRLNKSLSVPRHLIYLTIKSTQSSQLISRTWVRYLFYKNVYHHLRKSRKICLFLATICKSPFPFHGKVGDVTAVKKLSSGKWFAECHSKDQQVKLCSLEHMAGINLQCHNPTVKSKGVIYGSHGISKLDKQPHILKMERLHSNNSISTTTKIITFGLHSLPEKIRIESYWFRVLPFCAPSTDAQYVNFFLMGKGNANQNMRDAADAVD